MAVPINKTELQAAITTNYTKLRNEMINIAFDMTHRKELEGHSKGTIMSVKFACLSCRLGRIGFKMD